MTPASRSLGFMAGIGGNPAVRRLTLSSFSDNLLPAAVSCGFNAAGGAAARGVGRRIDGWKAGYGTIGVALIAIGLKAAVQPVDEVHIAVRELAAGMAGYVGDEVMDSVILWWKSESWKAGKVYPKGTFVRHTGGYWQAAEDVPVAGSEPAPSYTRPTSPLAVLSEDAMPTSVRPASCAARQRRSPAMSSKLLPCGRTMSGWTMPCSLMESASSRSVSGGKSLRG